MMVNKQIVLTYVYLLIYISLSSGVILYNKWVLSKNYFNFPYPITLTMIHMGFSGAVAFILVRILKVVQPVKMTFEIYASCVVPISAFFASSLWFGNTAYLFISVAFIQMLKALMPVATFLMAVICRTEKARCDLFLNMLLVSLGVAVSSYGEIHFNIVGTAYQITGILAEASRLVLTQVLLQKKGLSLNPITSLYYIAPCSFHLVKSLAKLRPADIVLILSISSALSGVVLYNYLKVREGHTSSALPLDVTSEKPKPLIKDRKFEKKSSDLFTEDSVGEGDRSPSPHTGDEEAPLIPANSRLSHIGRTQANNNNLV